MDASMDIDMDVDLGPEPEPEAIELVSCGISSYYADSNLPLRTLHPPECSIPKLLKCRTRRSILEVWMS